MQCEPRLHWVTMIGLVPSGESMPQNVQVMMLQVLASATVAFSDVLVDLIQ